MESSSPKHEFEPSPATQKAWQARAYFIQYRNSELDSQQSAQALDFAKQSFGEMYILTRDKLFTLAVYKTHPSSYHDAEEILQETYIKAFKNLHKFKGDSQVETWLTRILLNNLADYYKKKSKTLKDVDIDGMEVEFPLVGSNIDPEDSLLLAEQRADLAEELNQLRPHHATAVVLHHVLELSHEEVAKILGVATGTSKAWVNRGINKLRQNSEKA